MIQRNVPTRIKTEGIVQKWDPGPLPSDVSRVLVRDPNAPIEVTVVDDRDIVGWLASATRIGEVYMTNVSSMVNNVLRKIGSRQMTRLNILDHGNENVIQIGSDRITTDTVPTHRGNLVRLRGHFAGGGFVHLQHCNAGQNLRLMRSLAAFFGVPVYAGTGAHNPVYRFNFGDYVRCDPSGRCETDVSRP